MRRALWLLLFVPALQAQPVAPNRIRPAASHALAAIQKGSKGFYQFMRCFSCHDEGLPLMAYRMARAHGVAFDESAAAEMAAKGLETSPDLTSIDHAVQDPTIVDPALSDGWALMAAHAAGMKPNLVTEVYARRIATYQRPDGHWPTADDRPPQSYSLFTATAVAMRAMQLFMPAALENETQARTARAKRWLLAAKPRSTEGFTFRLFGLYWAGATAQESRRAARDLLALERPNGGWGELPHMPPDAYSTGEALVALHEAGGISTSKPSWQRGLNYLLATQHADGAWHVHTRMLSPAAVSPPYFESGFPHGHDQYLSTDATCWAAMALMLALPRAAAPPAPPSIASLAAKGLEPWMETALFGSAAQLKAKLDAGLSPNNHTTQGTTLLMMAANDPAKVRLLIGQGADVRAKAKSGFTALMVASTYYGDSDSVKLLLAHGAEANSGKGVLYDASPIALASFPGDVETIRLLLAKGADANRRMNVLGMFTTSPLINAVVYGDPTVVKALIAGGANVHERDGDKMTPLHWAVVAHHPAVVKVLLASGANVNAVDRFGYTPLLYASTIDFGDSETATVLLRVRANPNVKDQHGKTPLDHAGGYPYIRAALEEAGAK